EHGAGSASAEAGTGLRAGTALHQHQGDDRDGDQHVNHIEDQHHERGSRKLQRAAARAMARKSAATSEAPPINPPSTSAAANSSPALSGWTLPPYRSGRESAILASWVRIWPRMNACTACACSGEAVRPVPMAQTGS